MPRLSKNDKIRNDVLSILYGLKSSLDYRTFNAYNSKIREKRIDVVKRIKLELTKQYIVTVTIRYQFSERPNLENPIPHFRDRTHTLSFITIKPNINRIAKLEYEVYKYRIEEQSPIITRNWSYAITNTVEVQNNGIENIPMRDVYSYQLSNEISTSEKWDTHKGQCVIDYINYLWGTTKGLVKLAKKENLIKEFQFLADDNRRYIKTDDDEEPVLEPQYNILEVGINTNLIRWFCEKNDLSFYAFDSNENLILKNVSSKPDYKALIFRIINGHIYPIDDPKKRKQMINSTLDNKRMSDDEIVSKSAKKEEPDYEIIYPSPSNCGNDFIIQQIKKYNKIPFPFNSANISYSDGHFHYIVIDNKKILSEPMQYENGNLTDLGLVKEHIESLGEKYTGQNTVVILMKLWEETYHTSIKNHSLISKFNPMLYNFLNSEGVKYRTHYGNVLGENVNMDNINDLIENGKVKGWDIRKCYSSLLLNPLDNWLVYDILDEIEPASDLSFPLPFGLYVVETDDLTILHQTNIYSNKILDYAHSFGIKFKITHQIIKRQKYENESFENKKFFHPIIENVKKQKMDTKLMKLIINSITGMMGKTKTNHYKVSLNTNLQEVFENGLMKENNKNNEIYFEKINDIFVYGGKIQNELLSNSLPVYIQILDWSNIRLHQMIQQMGGNLIYRHTDMAVCYNAPDCEEIKEDETDFTNVWGTYKNESMTSLLHKNYLSYQKTDRHIEFPIVPEFKDFDYNSSSQYEEIIKCAIDNNGLLISGRAGTGKDYVIARGLPDLDSDCKLALTNKASNIMGGTTIHKALGINIDDKACSTMIQKYKHKKIIVVNEISMINANLWYKLYLLKKNNPHLIFILLGDYRQCQPIEDERIDVIDYNYFNSSIVKYLVNNNRTELNVRQRYDEQLWNFLENYYNKGIIGKLQHTSLTQNMLNEKKICYYNKTRKSINRYCNTQLKLSDSLFIDFEDDKDDPSRFPQQPAYIYSGLPIMCIKNNKDYDIVNGDEFVVEKFDDKFIYYGNDKKIEIEKFHSNFVLNYIATTHKLQGATIDGKLLIFDYDKLVLNRHLGYTAFSRVKQISQLYIV